MFACIQGHEKCVEFLLSHHADVNVRDKVQFPLPSKRKFNREQLCITIQDGWSAVMFGCLNKKVQIVKLLLDHNVDPNAQDEVVSHIM